jgi:hypothetical protein
MSNNSNNNKIKITKQYLIQCDYELDENIKNSLINTFNLAYNLDNLDNLDNFNGLLTYKYMYNIYKFIKPYYNHNISKNSILKTTYDIYSSYKFEHKLFITTNNNAKKNTHAFQLITNLINNTELGEHILNILDIKNIYIYKIKSDKTNKTNKIVFIDEPSATAKYYNEMNIIYKNILKANNYDIISKSIMINGHYETSQQKVNDCIKLKDHIFVLNPINFATFIFTSGINNAFNLINSIKYIVVWQEILNSDLSIIGYHHININFMTQFFKNSILNIVGNTVSLNTLYKLNIYHNIYYSIGGYSEINSIIPSLSTMDKISNSIKNIDIFIYGSMHPNHTYRNNIINKIKEQCSMYNILIAGDCWGNLLDHNLNSSKIVVHVPSHAHCNHIPWAKINYLQAKKIFYIVEENQELIDLEYDIIPCYKRNDVNNLMDKIKYYLSNQTDIDDYIEKNFYYSKTYHNLDSIIPNIFINI